MTIAMRPFFFVRLSFCLAVFPFCSFQLLSNAFRLFFESSARFGNVDDHVVDIRYVKTDARKKYEIEKKDENSIAIQGVCEKIGGKKIENRNSLEMLRECG